MRLIRKCPKDKVYTLHERCPACGGETKPAHPPRFSPVDRMVKYRILARRGKVC
ncbi:MULTISPECIES: RNA-protein complex protein Nop10 [Metallosphaera]|uniref:Ribosome biogenesis protein Nop10 n=3 Tax=Metallosphaera TaxID=41980 RepID=A4YHQ3_METS5|nr:MULTISPECIES: RNA-protein complex protein Nop10 [Metallosphaera]ABP95955.1 Nucleolar RNA-binding protein Nop10p [Metallosphaera sedula DSM 5348]AIM27939.1 Nucleolar RNA-binding protein Nop10p [Metallosphaera sedula]AKV74771.1 ribosome biogenesis protein Nop10 [Metallosphaera sedula]AKV77007.1 ribosome biogenesis protein Nop10 [Metallosphaera sedula]AKV79259.1 ribosome biogenesis protein Nop10 [Metallosphaera sedula]